MTELVKLSAQAHQGLHVVEDCALELASRQHVINLRATEVGKAAADLPVFITRNPHNGDWALSAVCSFEPGRNLFVEGGSWRAIYQPTSMQTYPLFLMQADDEKGYAVGIDESSAAFSREQGEALFDEQGKPSLYQSRITALLEADIRNDIQTRQFLQQLDSAGLIKPVDLQVHQGDETVNSIRGLHTIDEDKLQSLTADQLTQFNGNGYLFSIHAILLSIFQLNTLIRRLNSIEGRVVVRQVKLESSKDSAAA